MKKLALAIIASIILSACSPQGLTKEQQQATIDVAVATQLAAIPTVVATSTLIPFSALDLEPFLVKSGDLPAGYAGAQVRNKLSDLTKSAPTPDYFISQDLSYNGGNGGIIDVLVYDDSDKAVAVYKAVGNNLPADGKMEGANVGESSQAASTIKFISTASLSFIRCHAIVVIQLIQTNRVDDVVSYAKRLDKRLMPIICR